MANGLYEDISETEFQALLKTPGAYFGGSFNGWVGAYDSEGRIIGYVEDSGYEPRRFCRAVEPIPNNWAIGYLS